MQPAQSAKVSKIFTALRVEMLISKVKEARQEMINALLIVSSKDRS